MSFKTIGITEKDWKSTICLIQNLIRGYPCYNSEGLFYCQDLLVKYLKELTLENIFIDQFSDSDIKGLPGYVDVASFGSIFSHYSSIPKRNVIAILDSKIEGPTLILNGHIDVDFASDSNSWRKSGGKNSGIILENRLYGRGSTDMLSGLVSMATVLGYFQRNRGNWKGKIIFTAVTDEEIGGNGTLRSIEWLRQNGHLNSTGDEICCLIAEPSNEKICLSSLGFLHIIIEIQRHPVPMGVATRKNNAIWDACDLINNFEGLIVASAKEICSQVEERSIKTNIGIIEGGKDSAIPIPSIKIESTVFFPETINLSNFCASIKSRIEEYNHHAVISYSNFEFQGADFDICRLYRCLQNERTLNVDTLFPSPCDARLYKPYGIPTVIYGPGQLEQAHAENESIDLLEIKSYIEHLIVSLNKFLAL